MEEFYLYILHDEDKDKFYIGQTSNLHDRLLRHNSDRSKYTKSGKWKLVYTEKFSSRSEAVKREIYLKSLKSKVAIKKLTEHSD